MRRWQTRLTRVAMGGVVFGFLQGVDTINYNSILFDFLLRWINIVVAVLFGGSASSLQDAGAIV